MIMLHDIRGNFEFHLRQTVAFLRCYYSVNASADMQNHVVIAFILVVFMGEPIACLVVNFNVSHP